MYSTSIAVLLLVTLSVVCADGDQYYIGVGRYDVTGPAVETEMMGYAMPTQINNGIHFRQYSRAFIMADAEKKSRVVFVNADVCMGTQIMKIQVVNKLKALYGDMYTTDNVLISGIHTHSGPAGFFQYLLFEIMSLGFVEQSLTAIVDGIVESIKMAHDNMQPGYLTVNQGFLYDANINRSPSAYLNNPAEERAKYQYNTDKGMTVLKMVDKAGNGIGMIDWFAVHCTSMNNTNTLISGDNKGHASYLMERDMNKGALPGQGPFVAAFAQSNEGDVSPNTKGPRCLDTGLPCDFNHSTCNGKNEMCVAFGPGKDMFDSTRIIGEKQYNAGKALYNNASIDISGPIKFVHTFADFHNITVNVNGQQERTCPSAMGDSFAAGTTDGPGAFSFKQGDTTGNKLFELIRDVIKDPSPEQIKCHKPKPILLDTGEITFPYPWQPAILPLQILAVGQLVIIGVPAEFTTMSGRRLRDTVSKVLVENGFSKDFIPVVAGLSNTYADYVTTFEEFQVQRYEGASTIFGPHTLQAYIQEYSSLAASLAKGISVPAGPSPPNYLDKQWKFHLPVLFDATPSGKKFGDVAVDVKSSYKINDSAIAKFWAGNPRNNLMTGKTFLTVERKDSMGAWHVVYTDASWETKFQWEHTSRLLGESQATVTWDIPPTASPGGYRIVHSGYYKPNLTDSKVVFYNGTSSEFQVTATTKLNY
ncbi:uncharacterized protein LOC135349656 [Halichondria panicea]|uniref:uncharacterized protein LOC135349656 n=1 Tax=Halichondria panicea TaxID=6063 RepID=UPI00312B4628